MNIAEKMKQDWNHRAQHHARFWIATENYQTEEAFVQSGEDTAQTLLMTLQGLHQYSWKALEVGCGIGRVLRPLAPHFHQLVGVDVSSTMVAHCQTWLKNYPNVQMYETSGIDLQRFPDQHFDLVYSYVAFQHMPRQVFDRYLEEINRVLTPNGFLAFQLPIGAYTDAPLEDTIEVRSYPMKEIKEKLAGNGLAFFDHSSTQKKLPHILNPRDHHFWLAQKVRSLKTPIFVEWAELQHPHLKSPLEAHLYTIYANDCLQAGYVQEAIFTWQTLLKQNPDYLPGWLQLSTVFIETGQLPQALATLKDLTTLHPTYREGQITFQRLLKKCASLGFTHSKPLPTNEKIPVTHQSKEPSDSLLNEFSVYQIALQKLELCKNS